MKQYNQTDLFIINNCSYQAGGKDSYRVTGNKVDNIKVAVNTTSNDFFELNESFDHYIGKELKSNTDLYINSLNIEEFDNVNGLQIYNLIAEIRSKTNRELISEWNSFNENILIYDKNDDSFDIVKEKVSAVKRVYPLVIQTDESNFIMWHNFFNGFIHINKNSDGLYVMHLVTPRTDKLIANLLKGKFGNNWLLTGDSLEELIDKFYDGFTKK